MHPVGIVPKVQNDLGSTTICLTCVRKDRSALNLVVECLFALPDSVGEVAG